MWVVIYRYLSEWRSLNVSLKQDTFMKLRDEIKPRVKKSIPDPARVKLKSMICNLWNLS